MQKLDRQIEPAASGTALRQDQELRRIADAEQVTRAALDQSLGRLHRIVRSVGAESGVAGLPPPAAAVFRVAQAFGIDTRDQNVELAELRQVPSVRDVAERLGMRTRKIILETDWWRGDHGHFIAYLQPQEPVAVANDGDEKAEPVEVALIRNSGRRYTLFVPGRPDGIAVTPETAARIAPAAIELLPGLPQEVRGLRGLARFLIPMVRRDLAWTVGVGSAVGALGALFPIATAVVIDELIPGQELALLIQIGVALVAAALVNAALSLTQEMLQLRMNARTTLVLEGAVWDRILKLPASFFKAYSSGDLQSRINGIARLRSAVLGVALSIVTTVVFSVFYLGLLFYYDPRLAAVAFGLVFVITALTFVVGAIQLKFNRRQVEVAGWTTGYVFQVLQAIIKLRIAAAEDRAFVRWADRYGDERAAILTTRRISNQFGAFSSAYDTLVLAVIFAGVYVLSDARLSTGMFIAFLAAFTSFQAAFQGLGGTALTLLSVLPDWQRARPLLDAKPEREGRGADPGVLSGTLELSNVSFSYTPGTPVLDGVSLGAAAGEHIALVGESGSGKSTIVRIMLGLEQLGSGSMLYDAQDLAGLDVAKVRRQIGVVTQTGRLAAGTIMENIRGATNASYEECLEACELAGLSDDLSHFPMGLHTPLTEGGSTLSGGQRQRILIARALAGKPRILIFDEATSALDNRTQAVVTRNLAALNLTIVTVAHRLSTVKDADRIYVLDGGRIAETGNFDNLMARDGLFAAAAHRQLT